MHMSFGVLLFIPVLQNQWKMKMHDLLFLCHKPVCCRYTFFIVLYPMGVTGELLTIYAALPNVQKTGLYSVTLPNKYNFSFDYYTFLILIMISYIPRKSTCRFNFFSPFCDDRKQAAMILCFQQEFTLNHKFTEVHCIWQKEDFLEIITLLSHYYD